MLALCIYSSKVTTSTKSLAATASWVLPKGEICPPAGAAAHIWKQNSLLFPNTPVEKPHTRGAQDALSHLPPAGWRPPRVAEVLVLSQPQIRAP